MPLTGVSKPRARDALEAMPAGAARARTVQPVPLGARAHDRTRLTAPGSCACGGGCPRCGTASAPRSRLTVGAIRDRPEREADQVASEVMSSPAPSATAQRTGAASQPARGVEAPRSIDPMALTQGGEALSAPMRSFYEPRFARDLGGVRLHGGMHARQYNAHLRARAFTVGNHIWLGRH